MRHTRSGRPSLAAYLLIAGQAVNAVGNYTVPVAVPLLVLANGGGGRTVGVVMAVRALASFVGLAGGGLVADRMPRPLAMMLADAVSLLGMAAIAVRPHSPAVLLCGVVAVLGLCEGVYYPAWNAVVPDVATGAQVPRVNALIAFWTRLASVAGPGVVGLVTAAAGLRGAFVVDAATYAVSVAGVGALCARGALPVRRPPRGAEDAFVPALLAGARHIMSVPWLRGFVLYDMVYMGALYAPLTVLLPVLSLGKGWHAGGYALVVACLGVGALIGALAMRGRAWRAAPLVGTAASTVPLCLAALALPAVGTVWLFAVLYAMTGFGQEVFGVAWRTALQRRVPEHLLGRVFSADWCLSTLLLPVGLAVVAPLARHTSPGVVLGLGAGAALLAAALALTARGALTLGERPDTRFPR